MTYKVLLEELKKIAKDDQGLSSEVVLIDLLDYLAILDIDGAAELYAKLIKENVEAMQAGASKVSKHNGKKQRL